MRNQQEDYYFPPDRGALYQPPDTREHYVRALIRRTREHMLMHYEEAKILTKRNSILGILIVVFSSIVGASIFTSLLVEINAYFRIATGLISAAAAILAGGLTFLKYPERSEIHRFLGSRYSCLRDELEGIYHECQEKQDLPPGKLDHARFKRDELAAIGRPYSRRAESNYERRQTRHALRANRPIRRILKLARKKKFVSVGDVVETTPLHIENAERVLDMLEAKGVAKKRSFEDGTVRYDFSNNDTD